MKTYSVNKDVGQPIARLISLVAGLVVFLSIFCVGANASTMVASQPSNGTVTISVNCTTTAYCELFKQEGGTLKSIWGWSPGAYTKEFPVSTGSNYFLLNSYNGGNYGLTRVDQDSVTVTVTDTAPSISNIPNKTISSGQSTGSISFNVSDAETASSSLTVTATSSNTALLANTGISLGGSGGTRTLTATPVSGKSGQTTITVSVKDTQNRVASDSFVLTVAPTSSGSILSPPTPVVQTSSIVSPEDIADTDKLNVLGGSFRVDEGGAATYSIPIMVPAGSGGVTPEVNLVYSSAAGNGIAGQGWSLNAAGAVSRCRQTLFQDGEAKPITWSASDRFCLNGSKLVLVSGTYGSPNSVYKTEIDSFVKVVAVGGSAGHPDYFTVEAKDGSKSWYGGSGDSNSELAAYSGTSKQTNRVLSWGLSRFEDSVGNQIVYSYLDSADGQYINTITYAYDTSGTYHSKVQFNYEAGFRPDSSAGYQAGYAFHSKKRLSEIISSSRNWSQSSFTDLRTYKLIYQTNATYPKDSLSRLDRIEMCGIDVCHSEVATHFEYGAQQYSINASAAETVSLGWYNSSAGVLDFSTPDLDGDGVADVVWFSEEPLSGSDYRYTLKYRLSQSGKQYTLRSFTESSRKLPNASKIKISPLDINADGRSDLYFDGQLYVSLPQGDGSWKLGLPETMATFDSQKPTFVDLDGNGLIDEIAVTADGIVKRKLLMVDGNKPKSSHRYYKYVDASSITLSGGDTSWKFSTKNYSFGDFNGDGKTDIVIQVTKELDPITKLDGRGAPYEERQFEYSMAFYIRSGDAFEFMGAEAYSDGTKFQRAIDINGDGLTDYVYSTNYARNWYFALSTGTGLTNSTEIYSQPNNQTLHVGQSWFDYNQDGYMDFIYQDKAGKYIRAKIWNPSTNSYTSTYSIKYTGAEEYLAYFTLDANGDGFIDVAKFDASDKKLSFYHNVATDSHRTTLIYSIEDSLGNKTEIDYGVLSNTDHYTTLQGATTSSTPPKEVCQEKAVPAAGGGTYTYCYSAVTTTQNVDEFYTLLNDPFGDLPSDSVRLAPENHAPVLEVAGAMPVVTLVESSAPTASDLDAKVSVSYFYHHLRMQAAGRGLLGFKHIATADNQTGVLTQTTNRQDWPFVGYPIASVTKTKEGNILKSSETFYNIFNAPSASAQAAAEDEGTSSYNSIQVYSQKTLDRMYSLAGDGASQGDLISTVRSQFTPDTYGNMVNTSVETFAGDETDTLEKRVTTANRYLNSDNGQFLGRLVESVTVSTKPNLNIAGVSNSVEKKATFTYYGMGVNNCDGTAAHKGMLCEESVDGSNLTIKHFYDGHGNKIFTQSIEASTGKFRLSPLVSYDRVGRDVEQTFDIFDGVLSDTATSFYDVRYASLADDLGASFRLVSKVGALNSAGAATKIYTYVDNATTTVTNKAFTPYGAEYFSSDSSGAYSINTSSLSVADCPSGAAFTNREVSGAGAEVRTCFDKLGRPIRKLAKGFHGDGDYYHGWVYVDTQYDIHGRPYRISEPYFSSDSADYWTEVARYDLLGRPLEMRHPFNAVSRVEYNGLTTISTNAKNQSKEETKNVLGELVSVKNNANIRVEYDYDVYGKLVQMSGPVGDPTIIRFNGLGQKVSMSDPDKGDWRYKYNSFGDLVCQQDALNQLIISHYDFKGRKSERWDVPAASGRSCDSVLTASSATEITKWYYDTEKYAVGRLITEENEKAGYSKDYEYDKLGRISVTQTNIPGNDGIAPSTHYNKVNYDEYGRIFQTFDAAREGANFDNNAVQNIYDINGYLWRIVDAKQQNGSFAKEYYRIQEMDNRGNVTKATYADGVTQSQATFYEDSGLIKELLTRSGLKTHQKLTMAWDDVGNLQSREDKGQKANGAYRNLYEQFYYDNTNQLREYNISGDSVHKTTLTYKSDGSGNIHYKSDVGTYSYNASRPHAVSSAGGVSYYYNANGSMTSGNGRTLTYTIFDKVDSVTKGNLVTKFMYGPSRERYKRIDTRGTEKTTTLYLGNVEKVYHQDNTRLWRRTIGGVVQITSKFTGNTKTEEKTYTLHKDHLGSITAIVDATTGIAADYMAFDPWGKRRNDYDWKVMAASTLASKYFTFEKPITKRGFTGHEMMDETGIIHMNGRIYDPHLARFMQADPFIQSPSDVGSLNRYSYVLNNPLNATDPSGYFSLKQALGIAVGVVVGVWCQVCGANIINAMLTGAALAVFNNVLVTGSFAGALKAGVMGAITAGAFFKAGEYFLKASTANIDAGIENLHKFGSHAGEALHLTGKQVVGRIATHASVGGVMSKLQGGKFGHGFVSAGITASSSFVTDKFAWGQTRHGKILAATAVGGTVSKATGGKFSNGAMTGAFQAIFNDVAGKYYKDQYSWVNRLGNSLFGDGRYSDYGYGYESLEQALVIAEKNTVSTVLWKQSVSDAGGAISQHTGSVGSYVYEEDGRYWVGTHVNTTVADFGNALDEHGAAHTPAPPTVVAAVIVIRDRGYVPIDQKYESLLNQIKTPNGAINPNGTIVVRYSGNGAPKYNDRKVYKSN